MVWSPGQIVSNVQPIEHSVVYGVLQYGLHQKLNGIVVPPDEQWRGGIEDINLHRVVEDEFKVSSFVSSVLAV